MPNLKEQAAKLGIEVDGRWSDETLKEKIEEAKGQSGNKQSEPKVNTSTTFEQTPAPAPAPTPAPGEAREVPAIGGVRVETAEEVQETKENAGQPSYPYGGDPKEGHALAAENAQRFEQASRQVPDLPVAGTVSAAQTAEELYPIRLLYDWWDGQGVRHPRDEVVDMPLNEANKLMSEGKGEYAGKLTPRSA
ncbi:hypothetical protein [Agrobacterium rubi]|uniref:SAP domain-containing protein n=1 Tax=Agrobacterium rubi TaxID=28099 RepID=A0ABX2J2L6_9HYPH|nr:hypothetical protein [Agrobacterium rubi]NTF35559.1 hypothetical protein [Agrobacterium rubi]